MTGPGGWHVSIIPVVTIIRFICNDILFYVVFAYLYRNIGSIELLAEQNYYPSKNYYASIY